MSKVKISERHLIGYFCICICSRIWQMSIVGMATETKFTIVVFVFAYLCVVLAIVKSGNGSRDIIRYYCATFQQLFARLET